MTMLHTLIINLKTWEILWAVGFTQQFKHWLYEFKVCKCNRARRMNSRVSKWYEEHMNPWSTHLWLQVRLTDQNNNLISIVTTNKTETENVFENIGAFIVTKNLKVLFLYSRVKPPWNNWNLVLQLISYFGCRKLTFLHSIYIMQQPVNSKIPATYPAFHQPPGCQKGFQHSGGSRVWHQMHPETLQQLPDQCQFGSDLGWCSPETGKVQISPFHLLKYFESTPTQG